MASAKDRFIKWIMKKYAWREVVASQMAAQVMKNNDVDWFGYVMIRSGTRNIIGKWDDALSKRLRRSNPESYEKAICILVPTSVGVSNEPRK